MPRTPVSPPVPESAFTKDRAPIDHWLPWARLNLYRNPFGELTRQERAALAVVDVDAIARRIDRPRRAVQLVGACGRGKTTRLLALASKMAGASYVYLPEDAPCPAIPAGDPLLVDEAQRLPWAAARMIFSAGFPLVLATHRDLGRRLRRFGYRVSTERIGEANRPELICELLNRRIAASRLGDGPLPAVSLSDARRLVRRFGSDIRSIENHLYERVQAQVVHHGEMQLVD